MWSRDIISPPTSQCLHQINDLLSTTKTSQLTLRQMISTLTSPKQLLLVEDRILSCRSKATMILFPPPIDTEPWFYVSMEQVYRF